MQDRVKDKRYFIQEGRTLDLLGEAVDEIMQEDLRWEPVGRPFRFKQTASPVTGEIWWAQALYRETR